MSIFDHLPPRPPLPPFPRPPRLSKILVEHNPLHALVEDAKSFIETGRQDIRDVASRIRVEELFAGGDDNSTGVSPATLATTTEIVPPTIATTAPEPVTAPGPVATGVTDAETLQYQHDHLTEEFNLLETHLSENCTILNKTCDCCQKAAKRIKAYAMESVPIAARQGKDTAIYTQAAAWAESLLPIVTKEAVDSGKYKDRYPVESGTASKFRKALEKQCATCTPPKRLPDFMKNKLGR